MPAILPGYAYDIFISYRQKDNKYDGWVTEFVDHLKRELEATFKEDISVYFDENPHDGLRETHIVDRSLKEKLKCLIFIPIISRTYCDPSSFAWQHEFIAFNNLAKEDPLGIEVKLAGGNFASRILPVKINDIDAEDKNDIEKVLGGIMRPVEFIYRSTGVNRPLKPNDPRTENLNHTYYRDQINKVANSIKEIVAALKRYGQESSRPEIEAASHEKSIPEKRFKPKYALLIFIFIALGISGYLLLPALVKTAPDMLDKSIAVLPFENMSNDPEQDYFSDGMMTQVLDHLFKIGDLGIPSRTTSMRYKGSRLSLKEIAEELRVSYLLEGSVSKTGNNVRISVSLVNGKTEQIIWSETYIKGLTATEWFEVQSEIAQQVAENMNVVINPEVRSRIESVPTKNTEAYTLFLRARDLRSEKSFDLLEEAIRLDPLFADAYAELALHWIFSGGHPGTFKREEVLKNVDHLLQKAQALDSNSVLTHTTKGLYRLLYYWDFPEVEKQYRILKEIAPANTEIFKFYSDFFLSMGQYDEAYSISKREFERNRGNGVNWIDMVLAYYYKGLNDSARTTFEFYRKLFSEIPDITNILRIYNYLEKYDSTVNVFEKRYPDNNFKEITPYVLGHIGIAYFRTNHFEMSAKILQELVSKSKKSSNGSPSFFTAALYTAMYEKDKAIQYLQKAYADHEVEMYWLKVEPLFRPLHGDQRFEELLDKIGFKRSGTNVG